MIHVQFGRGRAGVSCMPKMSLSHWGMQEAPLRIGAPVFAVSPPKCGYQIPVEYFDGREWKLEPDLTRKAKLA